MHANGSCADRKGSDRHCGSRAEGRERSALTQFEQNQRRGYSFRTHEAEEPEVVDWVAVERDERDLQSGDSEDSGDTE